MAKAKRTKRPALSSRTSFANLPTDVKKRIHSIVVKAVFGRGGYKTVHGPDQSNRPRVTAETGPETMQLTADERNRLISLARNAARNSDHFEGILHQLELNVIGVEGGKAIFNFPADLEETGKKMQAEFAKWARSSEYFDDLNLQQVLKLVLRTLLIGGDCVLVFDWGITSTDAGQIISFEPDCIGNLEEKTFREKFPGYTQHQGIIKNPEGKTVGVVCSWSERGKTEYRLKEKNGKLSAWTMVKPAGMAWEDCPFRIVRTLQRFNQARGASRFWPGLGTIVDLSDYQGFEIQAAKWNAQKVATIEETPEQNEPEIDSELDDNVKAPIEGGEEGEDGSEASAQEGEEVDTRETLELEHIDATGALYDILPPGLKMSLLDTRHPNNALVEFSKYLRGGVAFAGGLSNVYAMGKADSSYSAAMAEFILANTEFRNQFHELEVEVLDWALANWAKMAQARGIIPGDDVLPPDWQHDFVVWQRPSERSIDPVKEQSALNSGLKNGTILYRDKLGPNWRKKLRDFAEEKNFMEKLGLVHPSTITVSGAQVETNATEKPENEGEE